MKQVGHWINGTHVDPAAGKWLDDEAPATGQVIAQIAAGSSADIDGAVKAAKAAQPAWAALPLEERCEILDRVANALDARRQEFAELESMDTGKPVRLAFDTDIARARDNFRFFADFARNDAAGIHEMPGGRNTTLRAPIGVCGLITPWNLPLYLLTWKVAPALAMGNAVVAKPSELTPLTADALGALMQSCGVPDGIYNVVHGLGPDVGAPLCEHPDVGAISFTGGTATGKLVAAAAAPRFAKVSLELGGKNPSIVFEDVDLDAAAAGVARAGFTNQGQVCLCGSRVLVHESIAPQFTDKLVAEVRQLTIGDPANPETKVGSLISKNHRDKVEGYVARGKADGTILVGGDRPSAPELAGGAFLNPTIITDLTQDHACVQEEIFGPVVTIQTFTDEAEAIAMANDVQYGLAATVWTTDRLRAERVSAALETGMVWVNDWLKRDLRVPFGGMKASGVGREGGRYSLGFFSEERNVYIPNEGLQ